MRFLVQFKCGPHLAFLLAAIAFSHATTTTSAAECLAGEGSYENVIVACEDELAGATAPHEQAALLIEKSKVHRRAGELDAARKAAEDATALTPGSADAWIEMGYVRRAMGDYEGALAAHSRARDAEPDSWRAVLVRLDALADVGRYAECLKDSVRAVELASDRAHTYAYRGRCLAELDRHGEAIADYETAVEMGLDEAFLYSNLALSNLDIGNHERALAAARRAVELDPSNEFGQLALVDALTALERNDEAIVAHRAAQTGGLQDTVGRANLLAWELYLDGEYAAAYTIMSDYFAAQPELGAEQAYEADTFAHVLAARNEPDRAVEMFLLAAELDAERAASYQIQLDHLGVDTRTHDLKDRLRDCVATGSACRLSD
ncbi:MAG TPA: tetratricopeptide repeat protein [Devosiaceae bacterium]|jgi:tetratricopeptide (TPR) repeat protein|nr:tetratricopeptide repeat protein [Devosiaceae bacterium]